MSGIRRDADQSDTDELVQALRDVLAGRPVRNADELIARYSAPRYEPSPAAAIKALVAVCDDLNARVGALERNKSLLREPVSIAPNTAPLGNPPNKPAGMA